MSNFVMLVGLPASGKSMKKDMTEYVNYIWYDTDEWRVKLFGTVGAVSSEQNNLLFRAIAKKIREDLKAGKSVIFAGTNVVSKRRKNYLEECTKGISDVYKKVIVVAVPVLHCWSRDAVREKSVGVPIVNKFYYAFQFPLKSEGWDVIDIDYSNCYHLNKQILKNHVEEVKAAMDFDQRNKNHKLTVGRHLRKASRYIKYNLFMYYRCLKIVRDEDYGFSKFGCLEDTEEARELKKMLYNVMLCHDLGKTKVKTEVNMKGETHYFKRGKSTLINCHYYNHENVSAYDAMFYRYCRELSNSSDVEVSEAHKLFVTLINYHMMMHLHKSVTQDKLEERFSKTELALLRIVNKADCFAR